MGIINVSLLVVAMAVFDPLGAFEALGPLRRLAYGALCAAGAWPFCHSMSAVVLYMMRFRSLIETVPAIVASVLLMGFLGTAVVYTVDSLFRPDNAASASLLQIFLTVTIMAILCSWFSHYIVFQQVGNAAEPGPPTPAADAGVADGTDVGNGGLVADGTAAETGDAACLGLSVLERPSTQAAPDATETAQAPFLDRLPSDLGRDLVFLKVDDHYIDVYTVAGHAIILMRFADAVAELGDYGMQVHRSYWVAHRHIEGMSRQGGRMRLRLFGGHVVPVSRRYHGVVRESAPS